MDDSTQTMRLARRYFDDWSEESFAPAGAGQSTVARRAYTAHGS